MPRMMDAYFARSWRESAKLQDSIVLTNLNYEQLYIVNLLFR
jgi:hypothetical protein